VNDVNDTRLSVCVSRVARFTDNNKSVTLTSSDVSADTTVTSTTDDVGVGVSASSNNTVYVVTLVSCDDLGFTRIHFGFGRQKFHTSEL